MDSVIQTTEQIDLLVSALGKAQAAMKGASQDRENPFFKSLYADLTSVWDACRGPLTTQGLAVLQGASASGATVRVETRIAHVSGQWMASTLAATGKDDSPQVIGSLVTYLRRYGLQTVAGVCPADDDSEAAQPRGTKTKTPTVPDGYAAWLATLQPAADKGQLGDLWRDTETAAYRAHLTSTDPQRFADLKAKSAAAKKVIAASKREPGEDG